MRLVNAVPSDMEPESRCSRLLGTLKSSHEKSQAFWILNILSAPHRKLKVEGWKQETRDSSLIFSAYRVF